MSRIIPLGRVLERVSPSPTVAEFRVALESIEPWTGALESAANADGDEGPGTAFDKGSVLFGKLRPYLAKVWVADRPGAFYGDFIHLRPKVGGEPRYFGYVLRARDLIDAAAAESTGSKMPRTEWDRLRRLRISSPPTPGEQRQIADYLDRETSEIDAFISDLRTMSALTEERWQSRLSEAMHGPHPQVNIRRVAAMRTGHTPSRRVTDYWADADIPWFTLADVWQLRKGNKYLGETKERISTAGLDNSAAELLPAGTVVLSRTASVGFTGIMPHPMATSQDFWNWVCGPLLQPDFLWNQFRAMKPEFERLKTGSTHKTIYQADAAGLTVRLPPMHIQRDVVDRIARAEANIRSEFADIDAAIALAKERRAALITAAVTGQIDVTLKQASAVERIQTAIEESR